MPKTLWLRIRALFQRSVVEREMADEMAFHLEMESQKNERLGMTREAARRQAMLSFGGVERHQESMRDGRGVRLLEDLLRDLRYAARSLRHHPGFTLAAVITLALAIGTNAAVFSVVNGLMIRPFPVPSADRLVALWMTNPADGGANQLGWDDYVDWRERSGIFTSLAAQVNAPLSLSEGGGAEVVWSEIVSGNYFATLGLTPQLGRFFAAGETARPGAAPYVVLGYDLWQRQFAGDRSVIGRVVRVNRTPVEVIGVAPRSFHGVRRFGFWAEMWLPFGAPGTESMMQGRGGGPLMTVGRLPAGMEMAQAQARASVFARGLSETHPATNRGVGALLTSARGPFDSPRYVPPRVVELAAGLGLFGVGLILLVACANVANLLLARASARRREMAVRLSIGSGRSRLIRQLLTESALLSLLGGVLSLPIAALAARWQGVMLPRLMFRVGLDVSLDHRVLIFTAGTTFLAVFLFGLVPALQATRLDLTSALRNESARARGRRFELRNVLVGTQIAFSALLLIAGTLFLRSLHATSQVELGLEPANRLVISTNPESFGYDVARARTYFRSAAQRVRELPGVSNAAWGFPVPFDTYNRSLPLYVQGVTENRDNQTASVNLSTIDPDFFEVVGTNVLSGREFTIGDSTGAPRVAIITRATAELFWPERSALGQRVRVNGPTGDELTVVGVVENVVFASPRQQNQPFIFLPNDQTGSKSMGLTLIVHGRNAAELIPRVRGVLQSVDAEVATYGAITMNHAVRNALNLQLSAATVAGTLALLALLLALIGLYGVVAYTVARSTREIGIRIALGARPASIIRLFVGNSARTTAAGLAFGVIGALIIGRSVASILYGVSGSDPLTFVAIPLALALVAALASYLPARRAARVPPGLALRQD